MVEGHICLGVQEVLGESMGDVIRCEKNHNLVSFVGFSVD